MCLTTTFFFCVLQHASIAEPTQERLLIVSTQRDFMAIWIYFVLHNCSLNFEIKNLHYTTDATLHAICSG